MYSNRSTCFWYVFLYAISLSFERRVKSIALPKITGDTLTNYCIYACCTHTQLISRFNSTKSFTTLVWKKIQHNLMHQKPCMHVAVAYVVRVDPRSVNKYDANESLMILPDEFSDGTCDGMNPKIPSRVKTRGNTIVRVLSLVVRDSYAQTRQATSSINITKLTYNSLCIR